MVGKSQTVNIIPASIAYRAYGKGSIIERFQCNYGLNEKYRNDLSDGKFKITGLDEDDNARIIEISTHRFFIATLFLPQFNSKPGLPHPLVSSFINAAIKFREMKDAE
jgi:CTP synthase (UTP-ammonia lyase)